MFYDPSMHSFNMKKTRWVKQRNPSYLIKLPLKVAMRKESMKLTSAKSTSCLCDSLFRVTGSAGESTSLDCKPIIHG